MFRRQSQAVSHLCAVPVLQAPSNSLKEAPPPQRRTPTAASLLQASWIREGGREEEEETGPAGR